MNFGEEIDGTLETVVEYFFRHKIFKRENAEAVTEDVGNGYGSILDRHSHCIH